MIVESCARCEGTHEVELKELTRHICDPITDIVWATHWAMCPTLNEPIIVFVDLCIEGS